MHRTNTIPSKFRATLDDRDKFFDDDTVENEVISTETNNPPDSIYLKALPTLLAATRSVLPEEHQEHYKDWIFLIFPRNCK